MNESGISKHMQSQLRYVLPRIPDTTSAAIVGSIDLKSPHNRVIHPELLKICQETMAQNLTTRDFDYPSKFFGDFALVQALSSFFNDYFQPSLKVAPEHVVVTPGSGSALDALIHTICDQGDSLIIVGPVSTNNTVWTRLTSVIKIKVSVVIVWDLTTTCHTKIMQQIRTAFAQTKNVKGLIVPNPHYPYGQCFPSGALLEMLEFCQKENLHFISDEVLATSMLDSSADQVSCPFTSVLAVGNMPMTIEGLEEGNTVIDRSRIHVIWSLSKDFGLGGIRMGCVVSQANQSLLHGVAAGSGWQYSSLSRVYATGLLTSPELPALIKLKSKRLTTNYHILTATLRQWGVRFIPVSTGLHVFAKFHEEATTGEQDMEFVERLKSGGVQVNSAQNFRGSHKKSGWVTIAFCVTEHELREGLDRIRKVLGN